MELIESLLAAVGEWPYAFAILAGLIAGSFLNVVIHRLPQAMFAAEEAEALAWASEEDKESAGANRSSADAENPARDQSLAEENMLAGARTRPGLWLLVWPGSSCPHCGRSIAWHDNIPLLSFLALRGRCRHCRQGIAWRYPLVELASALLCCACVWRLGATFEALATALLCLWLLAISVIDWRHMLIPDALSLSGMWLALLLASGGLIPTSPTEAIIGAAAGYLFFYLVYWGFRLATGKEGLGYGDFKLLAMLGAWLGIAMLPLVVLLGSLAGSLYGLVLSWRSSWHSQPFAFGPWLALAGVALALFPEAVDLLHWGRMR